MIRIENCVSTCGSSLIDPVQDHSADPAGPARGKKLIFRDLARRHGHVEQIAGQRVQPTRAPFHGNDLAVFGADDLLNNEPGKTGSGDGQDDHKVQGLIEDRAETALFRAGRRRGLDRMR